MRRFRASLDEPVVVVVAPAGYGKSTGVAQWLRSDPRRSAWVGLVEGSDDPADLLLHIAAALAATIPVPREVISELEYAHASARRRATLGLATAVASAPHPFVLALDDAQVLTGAENTDIVQTLVSHLPTGSQLVLIGRAELALPLARWRAEGRVCDVGAEDLRLDAQQTRVLLGAAGVEASPREVRELTAYTEGWPVGIYLAALARRSSRGGEFTPPPLRGDDRLVVDYLRAQVLEKIAPDQRDFLLHSAVLDELSGPLCDAVLQRRGSAHVLEQLEAANLFVVPLDRQRHRYRYTHFFQDLLLRELERAEPDAVPRLACRACDHYLKAADPETAMHYAQVAGDATRAARVFVSVALPWYAAGRAATLRRWLDWLDSQGSADPVLAVLAAWLSILTGQPADAEKWAAMAERPPESQLLPGGSISVEAWRCTLRAVMSVGAEQMREEAARALEWLGPESRFRPTASLMLGIAEYGEGNLGVAEARLFEAAELAAELQAPAAESLALATHALISIRQQRWAAADVFAERALTVAEQGHVNGYPTSAVSYAVAARVRLHRGDVRGARDCVAAAADLASGLTRVIAHLAVLTRVELAHAMSALGDADDAQRMLDEANLLAAHAPGFPKLRADLEALVAQLKEVRANASGIASLTPAEVRLIPLLSTQMSFREIAQELFVSPHTVKHQAGSIYRKLRVTSRTAAIRQCRDVGLLPSEPTDVR